jgi:trehalose 6-phosphate phosphatase
MTHWKQATHALIKLVQNPLFGLFSDLDGTLAPIALSPQVANLSPRARQLLADLKTELPLLALISGRRGASLAEKVGLPGLVYIGNHGLERFEDGQTLVLPAARPYLPKLQIVKDQLKALVQDGAFVEDKQATLSFHYRQVAAPEAFARQIETRITELVNKQGLVLFTGKRVFEVRPPIEMDKGIAFRDLVEAHGIKAALFLGDDVSDLNAFRMARQLRQEGICEAWGVGVQSEDAPEDLAAAADFLATGVSDVEELLAWVLKARKASST